MPIVRGQSTARGPFGLVIMLFVVTVKLAIRIGVIEECPWFSGWALN